MRFCELLENVKIDNVNGLGSTPNNQNVKYMGLKVYMKPSTFLKLASDFTPHKENLEHITNYIKDGGAIGAPFLQIKLPEEWEDDDYSVAASITGHEGRHRMRAIQAVHGDEPVEVHLFFNAGIRGRHITPQIQQELNRGMFKERSENTFISGPLFNVINETILHENNEAYDWLKSYTYDGMNKYPNPRVVQYLLNEYPNEKTMDIYRGLHFDTKEEYDSFISELQSNNNTITLSKISSWSPSYSTAEDFAITKKSYIPTLTLMSQEEEMRNSKESMTGYRGIVIKTTISPNTGINVSATEHAKENEVILPKGTYKVKIKTVKKKFKDHIDDGDETIAGIIDKMLDPKYKDDHYYKKFYEFVKHNYPDEIKKSEEFKEKVFKILKNRFGNRKVNYIGHENDKWLFDDYTRVSIYFNWGLFELYENDFLPDSKKSIITKYADKIVDKYYDLIKEYSGPEYFYELGSLRFLEKFVSDKGLKKITEILSIQVGNAYNMMNSRDTINKINKISDHTERKKAIRDYTETMERIFKQLGR